MKTPCLLAVAALAAIAAAHIALVGDSTVRELYNAIKESAEFANRTAYHGMYGCLESKHLLALKETKPEAVLWNLGLHLLHLHPARPCRARSKEVGIKECGNYSHVVRSSAEAIHDAAPDAVLVWKTTNAICEERFVGAYRDAVKAWHSNRTRQVMVDKCRRECSMFRSGGRRCEEEIFDRASTKRQHAISAQVLGDLPFSVAILDAYNITDGQCDMTAVRDGRHYPRLTERMVKELKLLLNKTGV